MATRDREGAGPLRPPGAVTFAWQQSLTRVEPYSYVVRTIRCADPPSIVNIAPVV